MKSLAIDCRSINKHKTGVGNVLFNILKRLELKSIKVTLFFDRELTEAEKSLFLLKEYNIEIINSKNYILWEQLLLPIRMRSNYDYIWFPSNTGSVFVKAKKIATIHDVIFDKKIKEIPLSGKINKDLARLYRKVFAKILAKQSIRVYTVSEFSKKDIVNSYKINSKKIRVIYNGLDDNYLDTNIKVVNKEDYILSFGSNEPRKNTELTIRAYSRMLEKYKDMSNVKLVLYGFRDYENSKCRKIIKELKLESKVRVFQYVSDEQLKSLYQKAKVFCFLSSFEGFGLPIIESMSQGTPVVALNNSSITEIVGKAGVLIKGEKDIDNIANEIHTLYVDYNSYNDFVEKGFNNIKKFNWEKSVKFLNDDLNTLITGK